MSSFLFWIKLWGFVSLIRCLNCPLFRSLLILWKLLWKCCCVCYLLFSLLSFRFFLCLSLLSLFLFFTLSEAFLNEFLFYFFLLEAFSLLFLFFSSFYSFIFFLFSIISFLRPNSPFPLIFLRFFSSLKVGLFYYSAYFSTILAFIWANGAFLDLIFFNWLKLRFWSSFSSSSIYFYSFCLLDYSKV